MLCNHGWRNNKLKDQKGLDQKGVENHCPILILLTRGKSDKGANTQDKQLPRPAYGVAKILLFA